MDRRKQRLKRDASIRADRSLEASLISEKIHSTQLSKERVQMASFLGEPRANEVIESKFEIITTKDQFKNWLEEITSFDKDAQIRVLLAIVKRFKPIFDENVSSDRNEAAVNKTIGLVESWLENHEEAVRSAVWTQIDEMIAVYTDEAEWVFAASQIPEMLQKVVTLVSLEESEMNKGVINNVEQSLASFGRFLKTDNILGLPDDFNIYTEAQKAVYNELVPWLLDEEAEPIVKDGLKGNLD